MGRGFSVGGCLYMGGDGVYIYNEDGSLLNFLILAYFLRL